MDGWMDGFGVCSFGAHRIDDLTQHIFFVRCDTDVEFSAGPSNFKNSGNCSLLTRKSWSKIIFPAREISGMWK